MLEQICSYTATLQAPEVTGPAPSGTRVNIYVTGAEFAGPGEKGSLRLGGGDWLTVRDGIGALDVRTTIKMEVGTLIDDAYRGS